jgi:pimeloyl-ACP methyl ester carboxylesterase
VAAVATIDIVLRPGVRYARADDGVTTAYSVVGDGPVTIVVVSPLVSQVEAARGEPAREQFWSRFAACARLVLFDRRGAGLSDRSADGDQLGLPALALDDSYPALPGDLAPRLAALVAAGHRGEAVELYQTIAVGMPAPIVEQMRHAPFRPGLEAMAHTLAYDAAVVGDRSLPAEMAGSIRVPALVLSGDQSPPFMQAAARAVADALPAGELHVLAGQGHDIDPEATATVIAAFLG